MEEHLREVAQASERKTRTTLLSNTTWQTTWYARRALQDLSRHGDICESARIRMLFVAWPLTSPSLCLKPNIFAWTSGCSSFVPSRGGAARRCKRPVLCIYTYMYLVAFQGPFLEPTEVFISTRNCRRSVEGKHDMRGMRKVVKSMASC